MIEIAGLNKAFKGNVVLSRMDLAIKEGDRIALIGQNGAGKTTLMRVLLGQYRYAGKVTVFGKDPKKNRVEILERVGFVPQIPPPIQISVQELMEYAAKISRTTDLKAIYEKAEILGLDLKRFRKRLFQNLSGGMKQKVLISIALAKNPELLILDEPAANLDPKGRQAFFLHLTKFMRNCTMIASSHRVDEVLNLINRIIEMDHGKIVTDDAIGEKHQNEKRLHCSIELSHPKETILRIFTNKWNFNASRKGMAFEGEILEEDRLDLLSDMSSNHAFIKEFSFKEL